MLMKPEKPEKPKPRKRRMSRGDRNIAWIENFCRIPEGPDVGRRVKLRDWQKNEIRKIYNNKFGTRRAIISFGRKNAKSTLSAMLLILHVAGLEAKRNSQLFSSAQSQKQAALVFKLAAKMIRMDVDLRSTIKVNDASMMLTCPELGTEYRALSAEVATSYGLNPVFMIHDELGQVKGPTSELYDALETATGAQVTPLSIIISTQAPDNGDLLSLLIDDAKARNDPRVVLSLYTAPMEDDPFAEDTIKKANPAYGDFLQKDEVLAMAADAKRMPALEAKFRNLILNQRVASDNPFISETAWMKAGHPVDADWGQAEVYGGLDLSAVHDLTALVLMAKITKGGGEFGSSRWQVKPYFWLPSGGLTEKSRKDHKPYDIWHRDGFLETTPGNSIDFEYIASRLFQITRGLNIKKIGFDRWRYENLKPWLLRAGFTEDELASLFTEFGQGYQSMAPALDNLEKLFLEDRIAHANHPVLKMCAAHAVVHIDPQLNRKLDKARSHGRIDGMVALAMAAGLAEATPEEKPKEYQMVFL